MQENAIKSYPNSCKGVLSTVTSTKTALYVKNRFDFFNMRDMIQVKICVFVNSHSFFNGFYDGTDCTEQV